MYPLFSILYLFSNHSFFDVLPNYFWMVFSVFIRVEGI